MILTRRLNRLKRLSERLAQISEPVEREKVSRTVDKIMLELTDDERDYLDDVRDGRA